MPSIAHASCLVCFGLALLGAPALAQDEGQPAEQSAGSQAPGRIEVDGLEHDFGDRLAEDPTIVDYVPVRNVGDGPLTITAVTTSCGCVVGKMRDTEDGAPVVILPGESSDLELRLNPAGWSGNKPTVITVRSDDPQMPEVRIRMKANVKSAIRLDPSPVAFGDSAKGETKEVVLTVAGRTDDFEVFAATVAGSRAFQVEVLDTATIERDGEMVGETTLKVILLPTATVGDHQGLITVRTTDRARRLQNVAVTAKILGDLEFDVPRIPAGALQMGESVTHKFRLMNRAGESFRILKIEEQDEKGRILGEANATATKLPEEEGVGYEVELTIVADRPEPGGLNGNIIFTTDLPLEEKAHVRYLGRIHPPGVTLDSERSGR
jgi:hypothetical protein